MCGMNIEAKIILESYLLSSSSLSEADLNDLF